MEEILHQLIGSLSHYLPGFIHPRWCRISSINSISPQLPIYCWPFKKGPHVTPLVTILLIPMGWLIFNVDEESEACVDVPNFTRPVSRGEEIRSFHKNIHLSRSKTTLLAVEIEGCSCFCGLDREKIFPIR